MWKEAGASMQVATVPHVHGRIAPHAASRVAAGARREISFPKRFPVFFFGSLIL
jgi:hypothetical protein